MRIFRLLVLLTLSGCALEKPQTNADYGPIPTEADQALMENNIKSKLKDPYSAHFSFEPFPVKVYVNGGLIDDFRVLMTGWREDVSVNAKNSFGAYIGDQIWSCFFHKDTHLICSPKSQTSGFVTEVPY